MVDFRPSADLRDRPPLHRSPAAAARSSGGRHGRKQRRFHLEFPTKTFEIASYLYDAQPISCCRQMCTISFSPIFIFFFVFFSFLFGMFLNRVSRVLFHTFDDGDYQLIISDRYSSHFVISIGSKFTEPENTRARWPSKSLPIRPDFAFRFKIFINKQKKKNNFRLFFLKTQS